MANGDLGLNVKKFRDGVSELQGSPYFMRLDIDCHQTADGFLIPVVECVRKFQIGEFPVVPCLREADDRKLVMKGQPSEKTRAECDRLEGPIAGFNKSELAGPCIENPNLVAMNSGGVWHR